MRIRQIVAAGLACIVSVSLGQLPAIATPEQGAQAPTSSPPAAASTAPTRSSAGDLVTPDPVSAQALARLKGERVEVVGSRTTVSSTFAMPDGTFTLGQAPGPIWVRSGRDGTRDADWQSVDINLVAGADGPVRPKAHPGGLVLSGGGTSPDGRFASVHGADRAEGVWLAWAGTLPTPTLQGPRAIYAEVAPGVDLVVDATRTGFEQFFVIKARPEKGKSPALKLTFGTEGGASLASTADGGAVINGSDGKALASLATPTAWDAAVDAERTHPVTIARESEAAAPGLTRDLLAQPSVKPSPGKDSAPRVADRSTKPDTVDRTPKAPVVPDSKPGTGNGTGKGKPGRATDPEAKAAKASPLLVLSRAVTTKDKGSANVDVTPGDDFLQDPDTVYPVVIDPTPSFSWGFDTWVQKTYTTDKSGDPELKLGTYNAGADVARSFINFNLSSLIGKTILGSTLNLWETWSYSCSARNWEVWNTEQASTATRWTAQPVWHNAQSVSSETKGHDSGCNPGWVAADTTGIVQAWANGGYTNVAFGLKAQSETDTYGWKRFNSANAGSNVPYLWVNYNSLPGTATNVTVTPTMSGADGILYSSTDVPSISAVGHDADGGNVNLLYKVRAYPATTAFWQTREMNVPVESPRSITVPAGVLTDGSRYAVSVATDDNIQWNAADSPWYDVVIDKTAPPAPASITSTDYPSDGTWHGAAGQAGTFIVTPTAGELNPAGYQWGLDVAVPTNPMSATGTISLAVTPPTNGPHVLGVRAIDKAGNFSPVVRYTFNVGRGGLISPSAGERMVRRARLVVTADPALPYAQFQWRRGPEAATPVALPLSVLTRADGSPLTAPWTALSSLGDYTTWDAGTTLGVGGPAQVRVVLATDANGANPYPSPWVDIVVDPNADGAASTGIGPGSVNLLTGDYSLSVTDADEFGLTVGRTSSSRDLRAGYQEQAQLLTSAQVGITGDLSGFAFPSVTGSSVTTQGHTGMDSLKLVPNNANSDTYAGVGGDVGGMRLGMRAGHAYRVSGWIYVPEATGLTPQDPRGLRIVGLIHTPVVGYNSPLSDGRASAAATVMNAWQKLTFDFVVPADATEAAIRLYNGFDLASGKEVFFDDLSVREIWAPLGPSWRLGTADAAADTGYTHIDQPTPDTARLNFSGGGEVWFTAGANGWWFPEMGAEDYTLTSGSTAGSFVLTEVDGTISTFTRRDNGLSMLDTTKPPTAPGTTRMVYEVVDQVTRLKRIIGPTEPGVDPTPGAQGVCGSDTPARGCEVTELFYATATTAGANFGDFATRLQRVEVWSTDPATGTVSRTPVAQYAYDATGRLREVWDPRVSPALKTAYDYDAAGHVISLTPAGEPPWRFGFAATPSDDNPGRLATVTRASLVAGSTSTLGPDNTTTMRYAVPLTRAANGPYNLGPADLATWGQKGAPTDATAVFGPADVPGATLGADDYKAATVHYLDSSGREVDTASPAAAGAPLAGYIDSADFDKFGNTVRTLDATNRLLALSLAPNASTDLATLGLVGTGMDSATRAAYLSTVSTYATNGIDLLTTRGPVRPLWSGGNPVVARLLTTTTYDQGKPDGQDYHLVTTSVTGAETTAIPPVVLDPVTTTTGYAPATAGDTSGWVVRKPTSVTLTAAGTSVTSTVKYDPAGRAIEARKPGSSGSDALTTRAVYWTAGPNSADGSCGNAHPEWAGQACVTVAAGAITGVDATRMGTALPVKRVTAYSRYGTPTVVTETGTGPVSGTTQTWTRSTTTTLDAAERVTSVAITGTNIAAGGSVDKVVTDYDPATGEAVASRSVNGSGTTTGTVSRQLDILGRTVKYTDATGAYATSSYDQFGQPKTYAEFTASGVSIGSRDFTYDRAIDPRGLLTRVHDSVAGDVTAVYGPDGQILTQDLPGGIRVATTYDPSVSPLSRVYTRISDNMVLGSSVISENTKGKWATHATTAASSSYTYDAFGRLTDVQQTTAATNVCTWRHYTFTDRAARTSKATKTSAGGCAPLSGGMGTPDSSIGYTYDSADRLVSDTSTATSPWTYDPLGRMTSARSSLNNALTLTSTYWDNDKVRTQTIAGVGTQSWTLDPLGRFNASTFTPAVGPGGSTKTNHYSSDGDNPAWIGESTTDPTVVTRYVTGIDGRLALSTSTTGDRVVQMVDLHGDVMGTLTLDATGAIGAPAYQVTDEYGVPLDLNSGGVSANAPPRYGWLGGAQRSGETLGGTILMGSRVYAPGVGRFLSIDPTPGGNANAYDYCTADPVNCSDLTGNWPDWGAVLNVVAVVAEVVATVVPGPIGTAAGFISAGAYLATGNTEKATEMAITATAQLIGAGLAAKAAVKAVQYASKIGRAVSKVAARADRTRVFWSGGGSEARAVAFAKANNGVTIGDMWYGKAAAKVDSAMTKAGAPWAMRKPVWTAASAAFARGARGPSHAFLNSAPRALGGTSRSSIYFKIERPILLRRGGQHTQHWF